MHSVQLIAKPAQRYGEQPDRKGLYLGLFHGRKSRMEKMEGWGFDGPMIGPLNWFHTTYTATLIVSFESGEDALRYFGTEDSEHFLELDGDMISFQGSLYGDWTAYYVSADHCTAPEDTFRNRKRSQGHWAHSCCLS